MNKLYSYVVARDYGFAPNPFGGYCTLATCKPRIRSTANVGDWIVGTGSKRKNRDGSLVFIMQVSEVMSFNEYWQDARFSRKKPNLRGSKKQAFGDNIYFRGCDGTWHQEDSHHSNSDGSPNRPNVVHDTRVNRVLVGVDHTYWGSDGLWLPPEFRDYNGEDICAGYGHKCRFSQDLVDAFIEWYHKIDEYGYCGDPADWSNTP